ncbi:hypothetical protein ANCCEY_02363 [Ancylostoma ceylanicum]|uniref:Uncharacterized protein n=1 Tax=Ancylostoma ceylanicum TaxID=53326 RepID=A0A0D6MC95_9BILA|nr:hypothetical protein ANCCEY_02363 [Ancylostoma ceylanicum]
MSASGGLSKEEFLVLQEQLIALRNRNYELQESLQKKNQEIAQLSSPKSDALQFASKLMNRRDKEKELMQKYEAELDALRVKLTTQEEEFRLQQKTLITELNKVGVLRCHPCIFSYNLNADFCPLPLPHHP